MNPELDKKLVADFPILYRDRHANMQHTVMCWGFECGDGWEPLIRELSAKIEAYNEQHPQSHVIASQVKEKYGGLCFYVSGAPPEINDLIDVYEVRSFKICEKCGKPGSRKENGWIVTLCDACYGDHAK